jgi:hypothetical protein
MCEAYNILLNELAISDEISKNIRGADYVLYVSNGPLSMMIKLNYFSVTGEMVQIYSVNLKTWWHSKLSEKIANTVQDLGDMLTK